LRSLALDISYKEMQSAYRAHLEGETLKLVMKHLVILLLYGICRTEWNYLKRTLELRVSSFSGKKRLKNVIKHIIDTNFNLFPFQNSILQNERNFGLFFDSAIQELCDSQIVRMKVEERYNHVKAYTVNIYTISEIGIQYFKREILPLMPDPILSTLRSIREQEELLVFQSTDSKLLDEERIKQ